MYVRDFCIPNSRPVFRGDGMQQLRKTNINFDAIAAVIQDLLILSSGRKRNTRRHFVWGRKELASKWTIRFLLLNGWRRRGCPSLNSLFCLLELLRLKTTRTVCVRCVVLQEMMLMALRVVQVKGDTPTPLALDSVDSHVTSDHQTIPNTSSAPVIYLPCVFRRRALCTLAKTIG